MSNLLQKKLIIDDDYKLPEIISDIQIKTNYEEYFPNKHFEDQLKFFFAVLYFFPESDKVFKKSLDVFTRIITNGGFAIINTKQITLHNIELCGMMMYHGFSKVFNKKIDSTNYIIFQKLYSKSQIKNPSTKFVIALDRVGFKGKNIKIHKIRSMHRYSEFLHQSMLEKEGLSSLGKVNSDPRITPFGKFIRKYWIDEIPQIYDFLLGKIKLVGIRAMSYTFFSQYPERYQKKYFQVKPGLICPIFESTNPGFDEILRIEEEYLDDYLKSPFKTDFKLFFRTIFMIFKGARSS
tara:strand:+ start:1991 stop:2869 length:879 start_codon:yes stop_codon:yes gene_type:complete